MKLCRFRSPATPWPSVGLLVDDSTLLDLTDAGVARLAELLDAADLPERIAALSKRSLRRVPLERHSQCVNSARRCDGVVHTLVR